MPSSLSKHQDFPDFPSLHHPYNIHVSIFRWGVVDDGDWHLALKDLQGRWEFWGVYPWCFFGSWLKLCCFGDFDRTWPTGCIFFNDFTRMLLDKLLGLDVCSTGPTVVHLDKEAPSKVQWPIVPSLVMVLVNKWSDASALGMRSHSGTGHPLETKFLKYLESSNVKLWSMPAGCRVCCYGERLAPDWTVLWVYEECSQMFRLKSLTLKAVRTLISSRTKTQHLMTLWSHLSASLRITSRD